MPRPTERPSEEERRAARAEARRQTEERRRQQALDDLRRRDAASEERQRRAAQQPSTSAATPSTSDAPQPSTSAMATVKREAEEMDTTERMDGTEAAGPSSVKRAKGGTGKDMSLGSPRDFISRGNVEKFTKRYFLTLDTFGQVAKLAVSTAGKESAWLASPLYVFNPNHVDQYLDSGEASFINQLKEGGCNVFADNVKGVLSLAGINAPFVTNTTNQAATNSNITLIGMTGTGLERLTTLIQGKATIADTTATLTDWTPHGKSAGYDYQGAQRLKPTAALTDTAWTATSGGADRNFVQYDCVGCTRFKPNGTNTTDITAKIGKMMQPFDITSSEGNIIDWDIDYDDCAVACATYPSNHHFVNNTAVTIGVDPTAKITSPDNGGAPVALTAATTANQVLGFGAHLSHRNVYRAGQVGFSAQELPAKKYVQLVPPPTTVQTTAQDLFIQCILDVEMSIRIERDSTWGNGLVGSNKHLLLPKTQFYGDSQSMFNGNCATVSQ